MIRGVLQYIMILCGERHIRETRFKLKVLKSFHRIYNQRISFIWIFNKHNFERLPYLSYTLFDFIIALYLFDISKFEIEICFAGKADCYFKWYNFNTFWIDLSWSGKAYKNNIDPDQPVNPHSPMQMYIVQELLT